MTSPLINVETLNHWIENFYGYGSWDAKIWFLRHEEPSGDMPQEVADKLNFFANIHHGANNPTLCDIRQLYKEVRFTPDRSKADVFDNLYDYRFGHNAVQGGEWKDIISFVHGYRNQPLTHPENLRDYQKNSLASGANNEALLRLYPLPAHSHAWYYSWLDLQELDFLNSRAAYEAHVYESRIQGILQNVSEYRPKIVVMYDMVRISRLKESVQHFFPGVSFKTVKAINRKIPQHHMVRLPDTKLVITTQRPGLRHNRVETGFDWEAFGRMLQSEK